MRNEPPPRRPADRRFALLASRAALALAALAGPGLPCLAQSTPADYRAGPEVTMELKNAQWFDGQGFKRGTLYVKDGKFSTQKIKKPQRKLNIKGQFLIAPLAEAHNHNLQNAWGWKRYAASYLRDGVFYAAMHCGEPKGTAAVRTLAALPSSEGAAKQAAGPELLLVSACLTSPDGQPLAQLLGEEASGSQARARAEEFLDKTVVALDSPEQLNQKWPAISGRKTDALKLVLSRSESPELRNDPKQFGRLGLRPELPPAIVRKAHQDKLRVIAQADTAADFQLAINAGVDWVARLPGLVFFEGTGAESYRISAEMAAEAARRKVAVITGIAASELFRMPAELLTQVRAQQADNLRTLQAAGVPLLLGSDLFNGSVLTELQQLDRLGVLDRRQLLRMASVDTPRALFPKRRLGCFEPGCEASFLLLAADPLKDLGALDKIQLRVRQGRLLGN